MFHVTGTDRALKVAQEGLLGQEHEGPFTEYLEEQELPRGNYLFGNLEDAVLWAHNTYGDDHVILQVDIQGLKIVRDPEQERLEAQDDPVDETDLDRWLVTGPISSQRIQIVPRNEIEAAR